MRRILIIIIITIVEVSVEVAVMKREITIRKSNKENPEKINAAQHNFLLPNDQQLPCPQTVTGTSQPTSHQGIN